MMNATIAQLTARALLGRKRVLALGIVPLIVIGLSALATAFGAGSDSGTITAIIGELGFGTVLPILGVVAGTSVLGPEIDDGSIIYLLAKPVRRSGVILSKFVVALAVAVVFGAGSILIGGIILSGGMSGAPVAYALAACVACVGYCAIALMLAALTKQAVAIAIGYAIVWEALIGRLVPGIRTLSVRQWALSISEKLLPDDASRATITSDVSAGTAATLIVITVALCLFVATQRIRSLRMTDAA